MSKKEQTPKDESKWKKFVEENSDEVNQEDEAESVLTQDSAPGIEFPSREELEGELTGFEQELAKYKDKLARVHAEFENFQRRAERDISNTRKYANEKLLIDMLPIVDSMIRGLEGADLNDAKVKAMADGMRLTLELVEKTLAKYGIEVIDPAPGELFNPEFHEAMSMQVNPEFDSNTIIQVLQKGYMLNGRVLRAAMVIVAQ